MLIMRQTEKRLRRLAALGGTRATAPYRRRMLQGLMPVELVAYGLLFAVLVPILVVLLVVLLALVLAMSLFATAFELALLAPRGRRPRPRALTPRALRERSASAPGGAGVARWSR
jgi:hypothetical protein